MTGRKYADADGYDRYMGGWSAALSPLFLDFVGLEDREATIVDLGCGTGNLLVEVARRYPGARLVGVDPSSVLLGKARKRPELIRATLLEGALEQVSLSEGSVDAVLSMLVLQEFPDRFNALEQMTRITRFGGIVAACQWDFARMPVIDALVEAIAFIDPTVGARVSSSTPAAFKNVAELSECWHQAGLVEVKAGRVAVSRTFASFDDLWLPLLAGSTPSTLALAAFPTEAREAVRAKMRESLRGAVQGEAIQITAEALVVAGKRFRGAES